MMYARRGVLCKVFVLLLLGFLILSYLNAGTSVDVSPSHKGRFSYNFQLENPSLDITQQSSEELLQIIQEKLPSLPILHWNQNKNKVMYYKNSSCARYPDVYNIQFENMYWQALHTSWANFQLFSAYYDTRSLSTIGPAVRIIAMIDRLKPDVQTHCQLWFENTKEPTIVKTWEYKYIWVEAWGNVKPGIYQPYLIACRIPKELSDKVPVSVSLVENPCDNATNSVRVGYQKPENGIKKGFAVCVKGLDFLHEDISIRLIEWIELLNILGADKIFFYQLQVHANISKVLNFYEKKGVIEVTPLTLPGGQPNLPILQHMYLKKKITNKRQNELIPYNDCLYKNMYMYEYLALLDTDEVIMPVNAENWAELMADIVPKSLTAKNEKRSSYIFQNVYFLDEQSHQHGLFEDIPKYQHMLQHVYRAVNFTRPNEYVKCFHDPQRVLTLHNHFAFACLGMACSRYAVDNTEARLQHYRADCVTGLKKSCQSFKENSIFDGTIWRHKTRLIDATTETLYKLGFLKNYEGSET